MFLDDRKPSPIWDAFDIDLFVRASQVTFFNPLFSMWVPLLTLSQRYPTTSTPFYLSCIYVAFTFFLSFFPWSSRVWTNRSWRSKNLISGLFSGPTLNWDNQIVVVTGGAGGIGRIIVETLAVMHATVVVIDQIEYQSDWDDVYGYKCDLSNSEEIEKTVKRIQEEVGHPTILINNAGVVQGKLLLDLTKEEVKQTFDVNVLSHFALLKAFLPNMIEKRKGHVVTVSSVFGLAGCAQLADYSASKHALMGLHDSLKYELRYRYNDPPIRTTLLTLGQLRTPLFSTLRAPSRLVSFLAPVVDPHIVAKAVIAALDTEQSREIYLPYYAGWVESLRGISSGARDFIVWVSGANEAMKTFKKKAE